MSSRGKRFRLLLVGIADKLSKDDVETVAYIYDIPMGERSEITAMDVLMKLETRGTFSIDNLGPLETLCRDINRNDLCPDVRRFQMEDKKSSRSESRIFLADIAGKLMKDDVQSMEYIYEMRMGEQSGFAALEVFRELEKRGTFSIDNLQPLVALFRRVHRADLSHDVLKFEKKRKSMKGSMLARLPPTLTSPLHQPLSSDPPSKGLEQVSFPPTLASPYYDPPSKGWELVSRLKRYSSAPDISDIVYKLKRYSSAPDISDIVYKLKRYSSAPDISGIVSGKCIQKDSGTSSGNYITEDIEFHLEDVVLELEAPKDIQEDIEVHAVSEFDPILSELEDVVLELEAPKDIQEDIEVHTDTFLAILIKIGDTLGKATDVESESGDNAFSILVQTVDFLNFHMLTEFHKEATVDSYFLKESIKAFMEKTTIHEYIASPLPRKRCEKLCPYKKLFSEVSFHLERSVAIVTLLDCEHLRRRLYDMITTEKLSAEVLFYDVTSGSVILKLWVRQGHALTLSTIMMKIPSSDVKVLREAGVVKVYVDGKPLEIPGLERAKKIPNRGKKSIENIRKELMTMRKKNAKLEKRVGELEKVHARSEVKERRLQSLLDKRPTIEQLQYLSWNDGIEQRQLRIIDQCSSKWNRIAIALHLFTYANSISDREDQMLLVFCKWLQANPDHCWKFLIDALETVELRTLAHDLKQALPFIYS